MFTSVGWVGAVLVYLALASLATGVVQSLVTRWVRHHWVIFKLGITVIATAVLVAYTATLDTFARSRRRSRSPGTG